MSAHMKKRPIDTAVIRMQHAGAIYQFPIKVAEKYRVANNNAFEATDLFAEINKKYTKPGALLKAIRIRENLTQVQLAKLIQVTQSDVSQMEKGTRSIGRKIAQRIEKLFDVDYRSFLA